MPDKILVSFDFDHTIIDENSDIFIINLAPNKVLPQDIKDMYSANGWVEYMDEIFQFLHKNGVTTKDLQECLHKIPLTSGMMDLIQYAGNQDRYEVIIISDTNSVFIDFILEHCNLKSKITKVFTNPAEFNSSGCLRINRYHTQDWCHLSTINLCKGTILKDYIKERNAEGISFTNIVYIGDGNNDLCPGLTLRSQDYLCPRVGYPLWKKIKQYEANQKSLTPHILPWESGLEILTVLKTIEAK